jgi:hypothetical protein
MTQGLADSKLKSLSEIEDVIAKAIKKVGARKENDLCRYIPMTTGGYMHHFTLKKMKTRQPQELGSMIEKFIISVDKPGRVTPKSRAPRGSRKRRDQITFTRGQLEKMLSLAKLTGEKEMIAILSPKRSLATCKRELISSIRHGIVEQELWNAYVEAINTQQAMNSFAEAMNIQPK